MSFSSESPCSLQYPKAARPREEVNIERETDYRFWGNEVRLLPKREGVNSRDGPQPLLYQQLSQCSNERLTRRALLLQKYLFRVGHIAGQDNVGADLSRPLGKQHCSFFLFDLSYIL